MTTPSDPDGTGTNDDLPYLPPARPTPPVDAPVVEAASVLTEGQQPTAPTLPDPTLPDPTSPSPLASVGAMPSGAVPTGTVTDAEQLSPRPLTATPDAREPVAAQRHGGPEPVDGSLPTATDDNAEASRQWRAEAQRKRRRNARVGWIVAVMLCGGAVVTGWFVYQAFDDDQGGGDAAEAADPVAAVDAETDTTTGVVGQNAVAERSSGADDVSDSSGGLGRAVDDARALLAEPDAPGADSVPSETSDTRTPLPGLPPPRIANRPEYRTLSYDVRAYDGVDAAAPYRNFSVTYDTVSDDYFGLVDDSVTGETELVSFSGEWRYSVGPDGVSRRARRSKFSMQPEPDTPLAALLAETDVLPMSARPFATLVSETPLDDDGIDGTPATVVVYQLDVDAFSTADPEAHAVWRASWATALHDNVDLVVPGTEQVQLTEATPFEAPLDREQVDLSVLERAGSSDQAPAAGLTVIGFIVTERGIVGEVEVMSPDDDQRVVYVASGYHDEPAVMTFSDGVWVDAP